MTPRRWLLLALAAAAVLILAGRAVARAYVDYEWFASLGAAELWRTRAMAVAVLRVASGLAAGAFVFANLYAVRRSVVSLVLPRRVANLEIPQEVSGRWLLAAVIALSLVFGALLSLPQDDWTSFLLARGGVPFGESDPYFNQDLGFFVYWLPFETALHTWTLISILIVAAIVLFLYALTPSLRWDRGTLYVSAYVRRHVMVLAGVLLLMLAWSYRLDMYTLLLQGSGTDGAFTYVDHVVGIPGSLVLAIATLGTALVVVIFGWRGQLRVAGAAIVAVLVLSLVVRQGAPWFATRGVADPALRERPYAATRAGYTRRAFALDHVVVDDSGRGVAFAALGDAARSASSWDAAALVHAAEGARPVDVRLGEIGWRATRFGLEALVPEHPLRPAGSTTEGVPWKLARVLAWTADDRGAPVRVDESGAPTSDDASLGIPLVHDSAAGYVVVDDTTDRIPGASLGSWSDRLAHAWSFQRPALLSGDLPPHAKLVMRRDLRGRVETLLPFFAQSSAITPLVVADSLLWVIDLYSASGYYPLSRDEMIAGDHRSYWHHAATAVVVAATGRVAVVPDSTLDPMATTWVRRFPELFTTWRALPLGTRAALPPAIDELRAQALALARYGTRANSDVPRHRPTADGADPLASGPDVPFVTADGSATAVALPLVTDRTDDVRGALVGVGGERRRTVWLAAAGDSARWSLVLDRLRAGEGTLVPAEAPVMRGPVRLVPMTDGRGAFVQSAYAWHAAGGATLQRVAALAGDSVRTGATFGELAGAAAGSGAGARSAPLPAGDLPTQVRALYQAMRDALRRGDWVAFGQAFDALGRIAPARKP